MSYTQVEEETGRQTVAINIDEASVKIECSNVLAELTQGSRFITSLYPVLLVYVLYSIKEEEEESKEGERNEEGERGRLSPPFIYSGSAS